MQLIEYDSNIKITEIVEPADFEQTVNINTGAISYENLILSFQKRIRRMLLALFWNQSIITKQL